MKFNFVSGDLEIIEDDNDEANKNETEINSSEKPIETQASNDNEEEDEKIQLLKRFDKPPAPGPGVTSTAEVVKKKLETQLKSIFRQPSSSSTRSAIRPAPSNLSIQYNETKVDDQFSREKTNEIRKKEMLNQINNHSFKDIDLIRIESRIEPTDLKDIKAAKEAKIPKLNTLYNVNVLKKPFSMKWLRSRRLTLFLQSELYSEFKLAMILAQFGLFNSDLESGIDKCLFYSVLSKYLYFLKLIFLTT